MAWRPARSIDVLTGEIRSRWPRTTVWTIGNEEHQEEWSDHNPNAKGVVCAADVLDDGGMPLGWFAARIVAVDPPALKYVIHRDKIWFPGYGWQPYYGAYHSHVHVSVGWGPDGRSTGPYDDTSPWGIKEDPMEPKDLIKLMSETVVDSSSLGPTRLIDLVKQPLALRKVVEDEVLPELAALKAAVAAAGVGPLDYDRLADALLRRIAATPPAG